MPKMSDDQIVNHILEDVTAAKNVAQQESEDNAKIYQLYRAKKMGNEIPGLAQLVSSDVFETIEWLAPDLGEIFSEAAGVPSLIPVGPEDENMSEVMNELIKYQFYRQNDGDSLLLDAVQDCLMYRPGAIIKWRWEKTGKEVQANLNNVSEEELLLLAAHKNVTIDKYEKGEVGYDVNITRTLVDYDGPRFELLAPWEFLRHPNYKDVETSPFVAHYKRVTIDYLRRQEEAGFYNNIDEAISMGYPPASPDDYTEQKIYTQDGYSRDPEPSSDEARKEVELYECYVQLDINGDGMLEDRIITIVGRTVIRNVENVYGRPPFSVIRCIKDTHKFSGIPISEYMEDLQKLNTFLLRQTIDNIAASNNARKVINPKIVNMADLMNNRTGAFIRVKDGVDVRSAIMELQTPQVNASVMNFFGISKELGEQRTGVSKAFKAAGDVHNQTASGQIAAISQASKRVRKMARIMSEGIKDMFRQMVLLNKKFMTEELTLRITENKYVTITPDDLEGRIDIDINILGGAVSKQQQIQNMQQLIAIGGQIVALGVPILDQSNLAEMYKEIIKNMGYKDADRFLPESIRKGRPQPNQQPQGSPGSNFPQTGNNVNSLNQLAAGGNAATEVVPAGGGIPVVTPEQQ